MTRGAIHRLVLPKGRGREQRGPRYGVIVQADEFAVLSTVIIAPTSTQALPASFRPEITVDGRPTRVLVEQLGAVDPKRLGEQVGVVTREEQRAIEDALALILDLRYN